MNFILASFIFIVTPEILEYEIIPDYKIKEFACRSCSRVILNKELLTRFTILSAIYGKKIYITSGYRNIKDNLRVRGEVNSAHLYGRAVDIVLPSNPRRLIWICKKVFPTVLVNYKKRYIHLQVEQEEL